MLRINKNVEVTNKQQLIPVYWMSLLKMPTDAIEWHQVLRLDQNLMFHYMGLDFRVSLTEYRQ